MGLWRERQREGGLPLLPGLLFVEQLCRIESVVLEELSINVGQPAVDLVGRGCV